MATLRPILATLLVAAATLMPCQAVQRFRPATGVSIPVDPSCLISNQFSADAPLRSDENSTAYLDLDLARLVHSSEGSQAETFDKLAVFVNNLKTAPSCARHATAGLLRSCQEIGGSVQRMSELSESDEVQLDDVKSSFAARLAVCELVEAGVLAPAQCTALAPKQERPDRVWGSLLYRDKRPVSDFGAASSVARKEMVMLCLKQLEARPQWWTSYSNARQNAVVICQAVRGQMEKDQLLDTYQSVTSVTGNLTLAVDQVLNTSNTILAQQASFVQQLRASQVKLQEQLFKAGSKAHGMVAQMTHGLDLLAKEISARFAALSNQAEEQSAAVLENIRQSKDEITAVQERTQVVFDELRRGQSDLTAKQMADWKASHSLSIDVATEWQSVRENTIAPAVAGINQLRAEYEYFASSMDSLQRTQGTMAQRFALMDNNIDNFEEKLQLLRMQLEEQQEAQVVFHESLSTLSHGIRRNIETVATSLTTLNVAVEEATKKADRIGSGSSWPLVLFLLLALHICAVNMRLAPLVLIGAVFLVAYNYMGSALVAFARAAANGTSFSFAKRPLLHIAATAQEHVGASAGASGLAAAMTLVVEVFAGLALVAVLAYLTSLAAVRRDRSSVLDAAAAAVRRGLRMPATVCRPSSMAEKNLGDATAHSISQDKKPQEQFQEPRTLLP